MLFLNFKKIIKIHRFLKKIFFIKNHKNSSFFGKNFFYKKSKIFFIKNHKNSSFFGKNFFYKKS
ncbi:MAG: hypothetical protein B6I24_04710 [Bacteroidetes bacterium 4572_128]|nr:MAG: hypothetical protein B6I24_04710 [Bacteroidetes bacterium 4572_128]